MAKMLLPASSAVGFQAGWSFPERGDVVALNTKVGRAFVHVVVADRGDDGTIKPMYDMVLACERGGGVCLVRRINADGSISIGLQKVWRPVVSEQNICSAAAPTILIHEAGFEAWECPRGFGDRTDLNGVVTALREGEEETGSAMKLVDILGEGVDNSASTYNRTVFVLAEVNLNRTGRVENDPGEAIIKRLTFFSISQIREMIPKGKIIDQFTLTAFALALFNKKNYLAPVKKS